MCYKRHGAGSSSSSFRASSSSVRHSELRPREELADTQIKADAHANNNIINVNPDVPTVEVRLEDRNVPQGHAGLHDALYGDGESHGAQTGDDNNNTDGDKATPTLADPVFLDDGRLMPARAMARGLEGTKVAATYAVFNGNNSGNDSKSHWTQCEFIGLTRNLGKSLNSHLEAYPESGGRVDKIMAVSFLYPSKKSMQTIVDRWETECKAVGGGVLFSPLVGSGFASSIGATTSESSDEEYASRKNKMRRAMADTTLLDEEELVDPGGDERKRLRRAVEIARGSLFDLDDEVSMTTSHFSLPSFIIIF